jgi:diacylglycerol kinase (ATP)
MHKYHLIINPAAGRGSSLDALPVVEDFFKQNGLTYAVEQTEQEGHAIELAYRAAKKGVQVIIAGGGDGTANEVINGLMKAKNEGATIPAMAVIPIGRGNDFAYSMKVAMGLDENLEQLKADHRHVIDIGRVILDGTEKRYFGNCIGVGFDAEVGFVAVKLKPLKGFASYIVAAILTDFIYFKAPFIELNYDGVERKMHSLMVSIMNGIRLGGGFYMTPDSINDDGHFDICIASNPSRWRVLTLMPHFMKGTQESQKEVEIVKAKKVKVKALEGSLPAHVDGETLCTAGNMVEVEILPKQISLIC